MTDEQPEDQEVQTPELTEETYPTSEGNARGSDPDLQAEMHEQDQEAEEFAKKFLTTVLRLRGVRIEREHFITSELHKRGVSRKNIKQAIEDSPVGAGIDPNVLDEVAKASIEFERNRSASISFAAGVPGGFAMLATIPGDITQFYVHVFRVMQKLAYIYGWQEFLEDTEKIDDETLGKLAGFLGIMMGITGAANSVRYFAINVARPAVQKKIAGMALTKYAWYTPMKQTLRVVGVHVTKQSFARTVTKVVPVIGGVVSGSFTFVTFNTQANRLMRYLRELPPPNVDAEEFLAGLRRAEETLAEQHEDDDVDQSKTSARETAVNLIKGTAPVVKSSGAAIAGKFKSLRSTVRKKVDDVAQSRQQPDEDSAEPSAEQ